MAFQLDSNIPLLARSGDPVAAASQGLQFGSMLDQLRTTREQAPIRQQLLQQQQEAGQLANQRQQQAIQAADQDRELSSIAQFAQEVLPHLEGDSIDIDSALEIANKRMARLTKEGKSPEQLRDTQEAISVLESEDASAINALIKNGNTAIEIAQTRGLLGAPGGKLSAEQRGFENLISDMSEGDQVKARRIKAGLDPKAGSSAEERIALNEQLTDLVTASKAQIAGATAESVAIGKAKGELKAAPLVAKAKSDIASAVKLATAEATARGEALSDLKKAEAGLPGLQEVTSKLRELSSIATHTITGKAFNVISKEFGFGATKGGTARAAYQATIDNQVLPLLKQTFGAAMTEGEGKRLAATLGDVDSPPEEKQAQLDAFMDSQIRQIDNLKRETGEATEQNSFTSSSGITFTVN
ncbi:MAG: hypothetical protein JKY81_04805 [Colwellia sp.]|nr:hypothetical protein [Colwellia sp.]